jgi:SpoIID/LytB domain protein
MVEPIPLPSMEPPMSARLRHPGLVGALTAAATAAGALGVTSASAMTGSPAVAGAGRLIVLTGRGLGHGAGMAQDSAAVMARQGASRERILEYFYPGTGRARLSGTVRVDVWEAGRSGRTVRLVLPDGGRVSSGGRRMRVRAGGEIRVTGRPGHYTVTRLGRRAGARTAADSLVGLGGSRSRTGRVRLVDVLLAAGSPTPTPDAGSPSVPLLPSGTASPSDSPSPQSPTPSPSSTSPGPPRPTGPPSPGRSAHPSHSPSPSPSRSRSTGGAHPGTLTTGAPVTVTPDRGGVTTVVATGRSYRGSLEALAAGGGYRLVNEVGVEQYLDGMGEIRDPSWPAAALQAQAVAERTYALRAAQAGNGPLGYELCATEACQVYLGAGAEYPAQDAAVAATRGEVVTYHGRLAQTFYSANAGGITASLREAFGSAARLPYIRARLPAAGPVDPWQLRASAAALARRLRYHGRIARVVVTARGPSGRALVVAVHGSAGVATMSGLAFAGRLGLHSTLFHVSAGYGPAQALPAPASYAAGQLPAQMARLLGPGRGSQPLVAPPPASGSPAAHRPGAALADGPRLPGLPVPAGPALAAAACLIAAAWGWLYVAGAVGGVRRLALELPLPGRLPGFRRMMESTRRHR